MQFNRLKLYRRDPEVRQAGRHKNRPPPICKEIANEIETEERSEDRPFHVFKPMTVESRAARNKPKVTFRQIPEIVEQDSESVIENVSRHAKTERQTSPRLINYEIIPSDDSENSESEQFTVRKDETERLLDEDHDSQKQSQQHSDAPTGRESRATRPPVRFRIDEFINESK